MGNPSLIPASARQSLTEPPPSGLQKNKVSELAEQLAEILGYSPGSDLTSFVRSLGGEIEIQDAIEWANGGGIVVRGEGDFTIFLSSSTSPLRDVFTIAHELAHYILHSQIGKIPCRVARSGANERLEWEANWFAASFLMPEAKFRAEFKKNPSPIYLSQIFGVSFEAAKIRIAVLGL